MKKYFEKVVSRFKEGEEGICELEQLYTKQNWNTKRKQAQ